MTDQPGDPRTRQLLQQAMRAVLSDDHNYERGLQTLTALVARVSAECGPSALEEFAVALALALATALERIANEQGLAAEDLLDLWFAE